MISSVRFRLKVTETTHWSEQGTTLLNCFGCYQLLMHLVLWIYCRLARYEIFKEYLSIGLLFRCTTHRLYAGSQHVSKEAIDATFGVHSQYNSYLYSNIRHQLDTNMENKPKPQIKHTYYMLQHNLFKNMVLWGEKNVLFQNNKS